MHVVTSVIRLARHVSCNSCGQSTCAIWLPSLPDLHVRHYTSHRCIMSKAKKVVMLLHVCSLVSCVCSYLGYGLMAGRAAVLAWEEARKSNPCVPTDHSVSIPTPICQVCLLLPRLPSVALSAFSSLPQTQFRWKLGPTMAHAQLSFNLNWVWGHQIKLV